MTQPGPFPPPGQPDAGPPNPAGWHAGTGPTHPGGPMTGGGRPPTPPGGPPPGWGPPGGPPPGPPPRRWPWILGAIALVVVVLTAGGVALVVTRQDDTSPPARTLPADSPSPSPKPCRPKIVDSGFWNNRDPYGKVVPAKDGRIDFGAIVKNPCKQTATHVTLDAYAFDAHGHQLTDGTTAPYAIPPGKMLGIPGIFNNGDPSYDASRVAKIKISVDLNFMAWSQGGYLQMVSATHVRAGSYNREEQRYPITFRINFKYPTDTLNHESICVVLRNAKGSMLSIELSVAPGDPQSGEVVHSFTPGPAMGVDPSRTEVYFLQSSD